MDSTRMVLLVFASLLVLGTGIFFAASSLSFPFEESNGSFLFASKERSPGAFISEFRESPRFLAVISPIQGDVFGGSTLANSSLLPAMAVLGGNDLNGVAVIRELDSSGHTLFCQTNLGEAQSNVELKGEACDTFLATQPEDTVFLYFESPQALPRGSLVWFEGKNAFVRPGNWAELGPLSLSLLDSLFPNALEILKRTNDATRTLK